MQNKANFKKAEMFVSYYLQKDCENEPGLCRLGKQTQTKPILRLRSGQVFESEVSLSGGRALTKLPLKDKLILCKEE